MTEATGSNCAPPVVVPEELVDDVAVPEEERLETPLELKPPIDEALLAELTEVAAEPVEVVRAPVELVSEPVAEDAPLEEKPVDERVAVDAVAVLGPALADEDATLAVAVLAVAEVDRPVPVALVVADEVELVADVALLRVEVTVDAVEVAREAEEPPLVAPGPVAAVELTVADAPLELVLVAARVEPVDEGVPPDEPMLDWVLAELGPPALEPSALPLEPDAPELAEDEPELAAAEAVEAAVRDELLADETPTLLELVLAEEPVAVELTALPRLDEAPEEATADDADPEASEPLEEDPTAEALELLARELEAVAEVEVLGSALSEHRHALRTPPLQIWIPGCPAAQVHGLCVPLTHWELLELQPAARIPNAATNNARWFMPLLGVRPEYSAHLRQARA